MEKYIKDIKKVYIKTNSYKKINKKLIESYRNKPDIETRNALLIQNIWLINYLVDKVIYKNNLSESLKEDIFGDTIVHFLEILDDIIYNTPDKYFSIRLYIALYRYLFLTYKKKQKLEFFEDLDYFQNEEENIFKKLDLEDFWTDFDNIKVILPRRSVMILLEYINGKDLKELGLEINLTRQRVKEILDKSIICLKINKKINEFRKYL